MFLKNMKAANAKYEHLVLLIYFQVTLGSNYVSSQIEALTNKQEADEKELSIRLEEINSLKASVQ